MKFILSDLDIILLIVQSMYELKEVKVVLFSSFIGFVSKVLPNSFKLPL